MYYMLVYVCFLYSAHNWNALFLGANAVADAMAEKYGTSKSQILDAVSYNYYVDSVLLWTGIIGM